MKSHRLSCALVCHKHWHRVILFVDGLDTTFNLISRIRVNHARDALIWRDIVFVTPTMLLSRQDRFLCLLATRQRSIVDAVAARVSLESGYASNICDARGKLLLIQHGIHSDENL